jgi:hypothetical protein
MFHVKFSVEHHLDHPITIVRDYGKDRQVIAITTATVTEKVENVVTLIGVGKAKCSISDGFNGRKGRTISLTRAIAHLPKQQRTEVWRTVYPKR